MSTHLPDLPATTRSATRAPRLASALERHPAALLAAIIVALTLLGATASALWPALGPRRAPHPTLHGRPAEAASILACNARTLIAPLLLCAGRWHTHPITRRVGDLLVAALVSANPILVGLALGRHRTDLPAYLPHLPFEDAALAIAAGAWLARRLPGGREPRLARCAALTLALAALAGLLETYAVPHRG